MTACEIKGVVALVACEVCGGSGKAKATDQNAYIYGTTAGKFINCVRCEGRKTETHRITLAELAAALKCVVVE